MLAADNDEDSSPSAYTSTKVKGAEDDVDKYIVEYAEEANKKVTITNLLKSILKNCKRTSHIKPHGESSDIDMAKDDETQQNELEEDEPPAFEDQTLLATDTLIRGDEPASDHFFLSFKLVSV